jgi:hypothetical protein
MTNWTDDEKLMEELARAEAQTRDVPPHRQQAAYGAFAWRTVDEDLLALTHDSSVLADAAVRGADDVRTLSFEGGGVSLEIEVDDGRVMGQVLQGLSCDVTIESSDGRSETVRADASGIFALTALSGPIRFAVEHDGVLRRTAWIVL